MAVKEFWGLVRQPQLLLLLLLGPVLIMVAFTLSFQAENARPSAVVVVEPGSQGERVFERFKKQFTKRTVFQGTVDDAEAATQRLIRGEVDAVIIIPEDPTETILGGEQAVLEARYNTINPIFGTAVPNRSNGLVLDLNREIVQASIAGEMEDIRSTQRQAQEIEGQLEQLSAAAETLTSDEARQATANLDDSLAALESTLDALEDPRDGESETLEDVREARENLETFRTAQDAGAEEIERRTGILELRQELDNLEGTFEAVPDVPPSVLANPFRLALENLASQPEVVGFYAPGVLAVLIQHISVSLASLAIIRERLSGAYEFFDVSPLGSGHLLAGKFVTYFGVVLAVNLVVAAVLTGALDIPVEGGWASLILAMVLLTVASLGFGFFASSVAKSELQTIQVAMLLLIGSGFFAGFLFPLSEMGQPAIGISYFLPATYGIRALQDVMIRGESIATFDLIGLSVMAVLSLAAARFFMGRKNL